MNLWLLLLDPLDRMSQMSCQSAIAHRFSSTASHEHWHHVQLWSLQHNPWLHFPKKKIILVYVNYLYDSSLRMDHTVSHYCGWQRISLSNPVNEIFNSQQQEGFSYITNEQGLNLLFPIQFIDMTYYSLLLQ